MMRFSELLDLKETLDLKNITLQRYIVLKSVADRGCSSATGIFLQTHLPLTVIRRELKALTEAGFIQWKSCSDLRRKWYRSTDAGREIVD